MARFSGYPIKFKGTGMYVPPKVVTNHDLEKIVNTSDQWIFERSGIKERRIASSEDLTSNFALQAARRALEDGKISTEDLDMIIVATNSPDTLFPSVAARVQGGLGAVNSGAMDIQAGCTGCIYAMTVGASGIASGLWRNVLVIGAEILSRIVDWEDRNTCVLFGDGAGALLMTRGEENETALCAADLRAEGTKHDYITLPGGLAALPASDETVKNRKHYVQMKGNDVFKFVNRKIPPFLKDFCKSCSVSLHDVDLWIFHQANLRIIDGVLHRLDISKEKTYVNLEKYGNTSAASLFIALHEARQAELVKPGGKILLCSFGAGMTYGAMLFSA